MPTYFHLLKLIELIIKWDTKYNLISINKRFVLLQHIVRVRFLYE